MAIVTVTELVFNFAEACRALAPCLDLAEVQWRDGQQGDNWDRVVEPLFQTLVVEPCVFQAVGERGAGKLRLGRYGFLPSAECNAWITVEDGRSDRMIDLASVQQPFDHVRCGDPHRLVAIKGVRFLFAFNKGDGVQHRLETVDLQAEWLLSTKAGHPHG